MRRILVYGFSGFDEIKTNPSEQIVSSLQGIEISGNVIETTILDVNQNSVREFIKNIEFERYDLILGVGLNINGSKLYLEQNADNKIIVDEQQDIICPDGSKNYQTAIKLKKVEKKMLEKDIPAQLSFSAGSYICNLAYYLSIYESEKQGFDSVLKGFIHIPPLPSTERELRQELSSLPYNTIISGLNVFIENAIKCQQKNTCKDRRFAQSL
ncbi:hypothetical protein [uncultured Draconibacterium sp.]|uniref:pyroglutamyl-peptidase I family protein n=1 Tax=uncultured Draconibacterium sp. TaxID=1573823 RepID=UPI0029C91188|nr:hypothetical protein [uncultured Draconibacterium sp.]